MQYDLSEFKRELEAASGMQAADLILENIRLVDVYTNEIPLPPGNYHGRIIAINPQQNHPAKKRIDGKINSPSRIYRYTYPYRNDLIDSGSAFGSHRSMGTTTLLWMQWKSRTSPESMGCWLSLKIQISCHFGFF
jgi:hypothetical protein